MTTPPIKPGFEFIFALSLLVILALPPMLMAQNQKDIEIKIENGDTTVNGVNIKNLSAADRQNALRDIKHLSANVIAGGDGGDNHVYFFRRIDTAAGHVKNDGRRNSMAETVVIKRDSAGNVRFGKQSADDRMIRMERKNKNALAGKGISSRNTQSFHYINTDSEGIITHLSFHVSEVSNDDLKKLPYIEGPRLTLNDLNIVPEFAAGKILLLFTLPSKGVAEIKLVDSEGKTLWREKAPGGSFSKQFVMGLNGIYYLQVKQGAGIAVKRILKDE